MTRTADAERRAELLDDIVDYILKNGLSDLSLRPLAKAVGSSPRVLLYYFESKERLIQEILARVRARQVAEFAQLRDSTFADPHEACMAVWNIMMQPKLQPLFRLFFEVFGLALQRPHEYREFLDHAVADWIEFFAAARIRDGESPAGARAYGTVMLAGFRGFLMDVCVTGDRKRVDAALRSWLDAMDAYYSNAPKRKRYAR